MRPADAAPADDPNRPNVAPAWPVTALGGAGLLALVTLAHPSATRMDTWPWALFAAALWLLPVALVLRRFLRPPVPTPPPLLAAGLGLLAAGALAAACASPFSALSLPRVWPTLGGVALSVLLHDWIVVAPETAIRRLRHCFTFGGALVVGVSLVGWIGAAWPGLWGSRNTVPFGHSNYTGGAIVLLLPWFAAAIAHTRGPARVGWSVVVAAALLVLAGTSSRGAVLALVVVAVSVATLAVIAAPWTRPRKLALLGLALALGACAVLANPRLRELARTGQWGESARESNRQREAMLAAGLRLGTERPWLGWGPGTVPLAYPRVRAGLDGGPDNVLQLHSAPVQLWATLGAPGIVALLLLAAGTVGATRRALRAGDRPAVLAAAASLGGYGFFALTDHQFNLPFVAACTAANLAVLAAAGGPGSPRTGSRWLRLVALGGVVALLGPPLLALVRDLGARRAYESGLTAREAGRMADYFAALDRATRLTPQDSFFQHQAAVALLEARAAERDPARQRALARAAATRLESSLAAGVHAEFAHFNLGWLHLDLGEPAAAARHFAAAARLAPARGGVYFGLGLALHAAGRADDAIRAFALEWISDPASVTSPSWEVPALVALRPAVRAEVGRIAGQLARADPRTAVVETWIRWWLGDNAELSAHPWFPGPAAADFAAAQPAIAARAPVAATAAWARLYAAWHTAGLPDAFLAVAGGDAPFAAALGRRAARHRDSFHFFLTAGTEDEPALLRTLRRGRTGYGVLTRHPDGPVLHDLYFVQENRIVADFAADLFPPKGWLPGRFLLALLPP